MFNKDGIIPRKLFDGTIYDLFRDKYNYMKWAKNVVGDSFDGIIEAFIKPYAVEARVYFLDEDCFSSNLINVTMKLQRNVDR